MFSVVSNYGDISSVCMRNSSPSLLESLYSLISDIYGLYNFHFQEHFSTCKGEDHEKTW